MNGSELVGAEWGLGVHCRGQREEASSLGVEDGPGSRKGQVHQERS